MTTHAHRDRSPIRLYRFAVSGHAHRAELFLSLLGLPFERIEIDLMQGEHKRPEFLARNPFGQIPVIEDGEVTLADSNAILVYLARRYDESEQWYPSDALATAEVQRWLSQAAGPLASGAATARAAVIFKRARQQAPVDIAVKLFERMNKHLEKRAFLTGTTPTIADVAMYTYTAHAPEGGVPLDPYPHVQAWLARIEALPGFIGMVRNPVAPALA
jgi:glutathione S-transferase